MESPSHKNVVTINNSNTGNDMGSAVGVPTSASKSMSGTNNLPGGVGVIDTSLPAEQQLKYENERLKLALAQRCVYVLYILN